MTTENTNETVEVSTPRSIGTLMNLGTFQGMTDEEIQKIIDFKVNIAHMDEESKAAKYAAKCNMETIETEMANMIESNESMMKKILSTVNQNVEPELTVVDFSSDE